MTPIPEAPKPSEFEVLAGTGRRRTCQGCRAGIVFYQLAATGRWMPFDEGAVILRTYQPDPASRVRYVLSGVTHFSTCPTPEAFRKRTTKPRPAEPELF